MNGIENNNVTIVLIMLGLALFLALLGQVFRTRLLIQEMNAAKKEIKELKSNMQTSFMLNGLNEQILVLHQNELAKLQDSIDENHNTYCDRLELIQDGVKRIYDRETNVMEGQCMGHDMDRESTAEIPTRDLSEGSEQESASDRIECDLRTVGCGENPIENVAENVGQI